MFVYHIKTKQKKKVVQMEKFMMFIVGVEDCMFRVPSVGLESIKLPTERGK